MLWPLVGVLAERAVRCFAFRRRPHVVRLRDGDFESQTVLVDAFNFFEFQTVLVFPEGKSIDVTTADNCASHAGA